VGGTLPQARSEREATTPPSTGSAAASEQQVHEGDRWVLAGVEASLPGGTVIHSRVIPSGMRNRFEAPPPCKPTVADVPVLVGKDRRRCGGMAV
jgi:hypothetical protein